MSDWISFFDSDHAIYVNARHREVHARITGAGMLSHIQPGDRVLDYGCGEAAYAETIAQRAGSLTLCEAAPHLRAALAMRVANNRKISVLSPEDVAALPHHSFDVVVMHSVAQYLSRDTLGDLLTLFRRLLRERGTLVLGDIVQPDTPAWKDALALLRFGARESFFLAALRGLARTAMSDYAKLRKQAGLSRYTESEMLTLLAQHGFDGARHRPNIGHLQTRMTFRASAR